MAHGPERWREWYSINIWKPQVASPSPQVTLILNLCNCCVCILVQAGSQQTRQGCSNDSFSKWKEHCVWAVGVLAKTALITLFSAVVLPTVGLGEDWMWCFNPVRILWFVWAQCICKSRCYFGLGIPDVLSHLEGGAWWTKHKIIALYDWSPHFAKLISQGPVGFERRWLIKCLRQHHGICPVKASLAVNRP